jgi:hypothetical protein
MSNYQKRAPNMWPSLFLRMGTLHLLMMIVIVEQIIYDPVNGLHWSELEIETEKAKGRSTSGDKLGK